jgi:osmotically-inducible protein OsmY
MKTLSILAAGAALLALAGCGKHDDQTVGQKVDQAIAQSKSAAEDAKRSAKSGLDEAAQATKEKSQELSQKTEELSKKTERAGQKVEDATITAAVKSDLAKDPDLKAVHINVDTTDGKVALNGSAPTEQAKQRAQQIAMSEKGVTAVDNQLVVASR